MAKRKGNPDIHKYGKKFSADYQPANRRRSMYKELKKKFALTKDEVKVMIEWLLSLDLEKLNDIAKSTKEYPIYVVIIANALLGDLTGKSLGNLETVLGRLIGKTPDNLNVNSKETHVVKLPKGLTKEDLLKLAEIDKDATSKEQ